MDSRSLHQSRCHGPVGSRAGGLPGGLVRTLDSFHLSCFSCQTIVGQCESSSCIKGDVSTLPYAYLWYPDRRTALKKKFRQQITHCCPVVQLSLGSATFTTQPRMCMCLLSSFMP